MNFADKMCAIAVEKQKRIVLPEGTEPRTQQAARIILDRKLASDVALVGAESAIRAQAEAGGVDLSGITIEDPAQSPRKSEFATELYNLRKHKGMTEEDAAVKIENDLNWGCMMVRLGYSDGMVAGAENATGKVLVSSFQIIKTSPGTKYASSCFVMAMEDEKWGTNGNMIFADCATIIDPSAEQLAEIAIASADSCKIYLKDEPRVALLSFSTKGSAQHENVDKVAEALKIVQEKRPDINVDGELQADAALVEAVGQKKSPGSSVAGKANVLVFPDLQSGNIGYKLVQRLAGAEAYGPILQGFAKPVSDLSRGCSVEDIVITTAMTLAQAK